MTGVAEPIRDGEGERPPIAAGPGDALYLAVAVVDYDRGWERLDGVERGASLLQRVFEQHGFVTTRLESPSRSELVSVLEVRDELREAGFAGPLVLVWSGHGRSVDQTLRLALRDTPQGSSMADGAFDPAGLVSFLAAAGSADSLVIVDACAAGEGDAAMLERQIRKLNSSTSAGEEPAFACIVTCKRYERATDGAFLHELVELLTQGPVDVRPGPLDVHWGPASETVPLVAVVDAIARRHRDRQHPRTWASGSSRIVFRNPRFDPDALPALLDAHYRRARGEPPRPTDLVETPASRALLDRVRAVRPGLWLLTGGRAAGKSSCLALAAQSADGLRVQLSARRGIAQIAAALATVPAAAAVAIDGLDEAPEHESRAIVELARGWSREHFVVLATRPPAAKDGAAAAAYGAAELAAERVVDVGAPEWQDDAVRRYVEARLMEARDGER